jgi:hypothetical protein
MTKGLPINWFLWYKRSLQPKREPIVRLDSLIESDAINPTVCTPKCAGFLGPSDQVSRLLLFSGVKKTAYSYS